MLPPSHGTGLEVVGKISVRPCRITRRKRWWMMTGLSETISDGKPERIPEILRRCGVAGAGGAGFPAYVKWSDLEETHALLVNHEESEPNFYSDKWLMREHADAYAELFEGLLGGVLNLIVIGAKWKHREPWMGPLEAAVDPAIYEPDELPLDPGSESGVVIAYTEPLYDLSQEPSLLWTTVGVQLGRDLPAEHGWIVQNSETVHNIYRALRHEDPVIRKYVHVDGETPRHRHFHVPLGTTADRLLRESGLEAGRPGNGNVLVDGGPGWCSLVDEPAGDYGVSKRTNAVMVLDEAMVESCRDDFEEHRINALDARDWTGRQHEVEPTAVTPDRVIVPLIDNPAFAGTVTPARPVVSEGDAVEAGDVIAEPAEGISLPAHASVAGVVRTVDERGIVIEA